MTLLSPSVARIERPLNECVRIINGLGCKSVHVDVCHGLALPNFFNLENVQNGVLCKFNACVTLHIFWLGHNLEINLHSLRKTDLVVLNVFPQTTREMIETFLKEISLVACRPGLSLDLGVDISAIKVFLDRIDTIFVMGIPVATYGLQIDDSVGHKLDEVIDFLADHNFSCRLGLDGGINAVTFPKFSTIVDELVIGGLLFNASDLKSQWKSLQKVAKEGDYAK